VERQIPSHSRADGHTVWYVAEMQPGISDDQVLLLCRTHEAILVTSDKDFGELVYRQGQAHHGVVLLRMAGASTKTKALLLGAFVTQHGERIAGAFSVPEPGRARIRTAT
jgi:predicted nuclease of predicted toxin-antitoxin system